MRVMLGYDELEEAIDLYIQAKFKGYYHDGENLDWQYADAESNGDPAPVCGVSVWIRVAPPKEGTPA